jgi:hypothetical protein
MIFVPALEQPLTQNDVDALMRELRGIYLEDGIAHSLARYMHVSEATTAKAKQEEKESQEFMLEELGRTMRTKIQMKTKRTAIILTSAS